MDEKQIKNEGLFRAKMARLVAKSIDLFIVLILAMVYYPMGLILAGVYLSLCDAFVDGQSVGKKLIGFAVVSLEDGTPCSVKQSVIRNLPILIPIGFALIPLWGWIVASFLSLPLIFLEVVILMRSLTGHRLGDIMADTTVIANDENRADIKKKKTSWFESENSPIPLQ